MKNNGITLIALVITIIVLLILAGVSISAISGENGIVDKAKEAAEKTEEAEKEEQGTLEGYEDWINDSIDESNIIKFKVGEVEYEAEEGMTWEEWIESEYNIDEFYIHGNTVIVNSYFLQKPITEDTAEAQEKHHKIEEGAQYLLKSAVGGGGELEWD